MKNWRWYLIAAAIGAAITAAAFLIYTNILSPSSGVQIIVTNFSVVTNYADRYVTVEVSSYPPECRALATERNLINSKYQSYAFGLPTFLSNVGNCVDFKLSATVYRMCYSVALPPERIRWRIGGGYFARGGIAVAAGIDWMFLDGSAIFLTGLPGAWNPDIGVIVSFRGQF